MKKLINNLHWLFLLFVLVPVTALAVPIQVPYPDQLSESEFLTDGSPSIEFTSIPPYSTTQLLRGKVRNASPDSFVVAPYIFVEGSGWWTKPYFVQPVVPIQADSTWSTTITTGGSDIYATRICVFLIPMGVTPPESGGLACLPSSLDTVAISEACTTRAARSIQFSGIRWYKKASVGEVGPEGNYFCDDSTNVSVDAQGRLHLRITRRGTEDYRYSCASEVISTVSFGYGRYLWKLASPVGALNQNVVLGLFTWDNDACDEFFRELDIEFSRWGVATDPNAQYVVTPYYHEAEIRNRWSMPEDVVLSTHSLEWQPDRIVFRSWRGHSNEPHLDSLIYCWVYTGTRIPSPGTLKPRINLWLYGADSTSDGSDVEVIISEFFSDTPTPVICVVEEPPSFLLKWGSLGSGDGQFAYPTGVAVDANGSVYVAAEYNHRMQKFTSTGTFLTKWGTYGSGNGQFLNPEGVAVDANGNVYVADTGNYRIQKFTSTGAFVTTWGDSGSGDGQFDYPRGIAVDADSNVYVADTNNSRIQKFTSTGTFLTKWGTYGFGDGQFAYPFGVAVDTDSNVYVVDRNNPRIQKFTSTGTFLTKWGTYGFGDGQFAYPTAVAVDANGSVYVADRENHRIQKFTSTGTFLTKWGSLGSGDGQFDLPWGITVDANGGVYVADNDNHRIQKFGPAPPVGVEPGVTQPQLWLAPATPNPWTGQTTLRFKLARENRASLVIYDLLGRRLKHWSWPTLPAGPRQVIWDGRTDDGQSTAPGLLFYRLESGGQVLKQKMIRLQ